MSGDVDRIPETTFKAVSGIMPGLAIIAAVVRTVYRLRSHRRLFVDDLFLWIACVCLTVGTIVLYTMTTDLYLSYTGWTLFLAEDFEGGVKRGVIYLRRFFAYASMTWTAIYAVKLSFLFFFRVLVERIRYMTIYWRVVLGSTIVAFCLCVLQCAFGSGMNRTVIVTAVATVVDFLTDLMIIALPIHLPWKVRMKTRQKFGLGVFLCLSVFMMMIAVVRVSVQHRHVVVLGMPLTAVDFTWNLFWLQTEACLAVLMVSLTALRSIFVSDNYRGGGHARARPIRPHMSPATLSRQRFWPSRKKLASSDGADSDARGLPSIPSATITGLRTFIRGDCSDHADRGGTTPGITMTTALQSAVFQEKTIASSESAPVSVAEFTVSPNRHEHGGEEV
ncbi:MAG: hypothetical protein M1826_000123 [Phylliscum demangeonii]|nr:MAG: hypothetical protein M1826_000123 [Phylliscum demangeonii]